tara:strand:- start:749 stop:1111 length:363 start_codon:yes stop_codon:yes gene_type:complete
MKTYFDVVTDFVGIENICNGPSNGPISEIKFIDGFVNIPTEAEIQAKIAELQAAEPLRQLREQRTRILQESDWMANSDVTISDAWRTYRQALRDLPANSPNVALDEQGNLINVTWPTKPE